MSNRYTDGERLDRHETRILFNCLVDCKRSNIITFAIIDIKLSRTALARVNETIYQIQLVE